MKGEGVTYAREGGRLRRGKAWSPYATGMWGHWGEVWSDMVCVCLLVCALANAGLHMPFKSECIMDHVPLPRACCVQVSLCAAYNRTRQAITRAQALVRGRCVRGAYRQRRAACVALQRWWRSAGAAGRAPVTQPPGVLPVPTPYPPCAQRRATTGLQNVLVGGSHARRPQPPQPFLKIRLCD